MNDEAADEIARRAAPVYYITGTIHSTEAGAPTALMELAYRLAVDDSAYIRNIREHVITLITPVVEPDGRDRVVDVYEWRKKNPKSTPMSPVYWGHYVAHDNNRDAMALTLKLSQNVLNTYLGWKAQVLHDLHESGSFLYDNTIGNGPYNAWLDPILTNEWHLIGWNNVNEMTRMGMPGVYAWGTFDTWSPGYLMFMAATHNGISRLYETFGNSGSADTEERTLSPNETSRTWFRQNPPISRVRWSLRNNNNYEQTGLLISLNQIASNRVYFLRNFYEKSKRSILKAKVEGPGRLRLSGQRSAPRRAGGAAARAAEAGGRDLPRDRRVHGDDSGAAGRRGPGARRARRPAVATPMPMPTAAGAADEAAAATAALAPVKLPPTTREFPAGSYIVRMDQPYSRIADALLDYQVLGAERARRRGPTTTPGGPFPRALPCRRSGSPTSRCSTSRWSRSRGDFAAVRRARAGDHVRGESQRGQRADLAALRAEGCRHPDRRRAVRVGRDQVRARLVRHHQGAGDRSRPGGEGAGAARACDRVGAVGQDAPGPRRPGRDPARLDQHPDRRVVAAGVRHLQDPLRLHRSAGRPRHRQRCAAKYDVIVFGPGGNQSVVQGLPLWRTPIPYRHSTETPNIGTWAQTDDTRIGMGLAGADAPARVHRRRRRVRRRRTAAPSSRSPTSPMASA